MQLSPFCSDEDIVEMKKPTYVKQNPSKKNRANSTLKIMIKLHKWRLNKHIYPKKAAYSNQNNRNNRVKYKSCDLPTYPISCITHTRNNQS